MSNLNKEKREVVKLLMLGNSSVGSTSIRDVFLGQRFINDTLATIGSNKADSMFKLNNGKEVKIVIWDTAGQERFHAMALSLLRYNQGVILVYDVTNRKSFEDLKIWLNDINNITNKVSIVLFGNKCDIENRKVTKEEAEKFAKENNIPYFETSAKSRKNIDEGFSHVINDAYSKFGPSLGFQLKLRKKKKKCL